LETPEEFRQRVGRVDVGASLDFRSRGQVLRDFVLAIVLLIAFVALTLWWSWPSLASIGAALVAFTAYCAIAYFLRLRPNHEEIGLVGGLADHPFRWSDGVNRWLMNLVIALAPGRFIAVGLVDGLRLLARGQLPHERLMQKLESGSSERDKND
jgi:hypothetical protein